MRVAKRFYTKMFNDLLDLLWESGFFYIDWKMIVMWVVVGVLFYLAVRHQFEPLLLIPIAFGALLANLPTAGVINRPAGDINSPVTGYVQYVFLEKGNTVTLPRVVKTQPEALWRLVQDQPKEKFQELAQAFFDRTEKYTATEVSESTLPEFKNAPAPKSAIEAAEDRGEGVPSLVAIVRPTQKNTGDREWMEKTYKVTFKGKEIEIAPKDRLVWLDANGFVAEVKAKDGSPIMRDTPILTLASSHSGGLYYYIQKGVLLEIFPPIIFLGVGALTDFGPLIANPRTLLLGAAAQFGVFFTFFCAIPMGFSAPEAASIGIIGGADGPTSIFLSNKLAPNLLAPIAVAAYSYMALVPVIQPPVMRLLTTEAERKIRMKSLRKVGKLEKLIFAVFVTLFCIMIVPDASALIGMLMFGNFIRESGVCERLSKCAQNELINIVTIFLGSSVGITMTADRFLNKQTLFILALGVVAFVISTAAGVLMAKFMNLFSKDKINPLIGSAGVSAVPMAARVSHVEGQKADPSNFLLMHAMGPNVAGVIGTAVAAGIFISTLSSLVK